MAIWLAKPTTDSCHCLLCSKYDYNGHDVDREKIRTQSEATRYWPCFYLNIDWANDSAMFLTNSAPQNVQGPFDLESSLLRAQRVNLCYPSYVDK